MARKRLQDDFDPAEPDQPDFIQVDPAHVLSEEQVLDPSLHLPIEVEPRLVAEAGARGDLLATLAVDLPRSLTARQKELFDELRKSGA